MTKTYKIRNGYDSKYDKYFIEIDNDGIKNRAYLSADSYIDLAKNMILLVDKNNNIE